MPGSARTALRRIAQRVKSAVGRGGMPRHIARRLAALGAVIDTQDTARLYAPLHERAPYRGVRVERDLAYGPDARHVLDVFAPAAAAAALRPVLMFVHGGGFFGGGRRTPDDASPFHDNVMLFAARNGVVGVNATYRLTPQHRWPAGAEDVAAAVRWVGAGIAAHGGDPARVFVMGHSAGATHVAGYLADRRLHGRGGVGLAGAILVSGLYDLSGRTLFDGELAYFGEDVSLHPERAALPGVAEPPIPLMIVHAEHDPAVFHREAGRLAASLARAGRVARTVLLAGHGHISEIYAINTADTSLSREILAFVNGSM